MQFPEQIGNISQTPFFFFLEKQNDDHMISQYLWLT